MVDRIADVTHSRLRINGGYFIFRRDIFRYMRDGEELLHEPFQRLVAERHLVAHEHDGFWMSMDTFKDKQMLDDLHSGGRAPWEIWKRPPGVASLGERPHGTASSHIGSAASLGVRHAAAADIRS